MEEAAKAAKAREAAAAKAALDVAIADQASGHANAAADTLKAAGQLAAEVHSNATAVQPGDATAAAMAGDTAAGESNSSVSKEASHEADADIKAIEGSAIADGDTTASSGQATSDTAGQASPNVSKEASQEADADIEAIEDSAIASANDNTATKSDQAPDEVLLEELLFA